MRIAVFLDQSFPPDSRVENEAYSLIKAGHEVHMFSLNFKGLTPAYEEINGIRVHRISAGQLLYKSSALAYDWSWFHKQVQKKVSSFLRTILPEAIHVHDMLIAKPVMDANDAWEKRPLTLDLHENRPEIMQYYPHLKKLPGKWLISINRWRKAQNELIKRADQVVMVTPEAIDVAIKETGVSRDKFISLPNTIEPDIYLHYPIDQKIVEKFKKGFDIVYVGDTGLRRGLDTALYALKILLKDVPQAQLIMVGKSTEDDQLMEIVQQEGLSANVLFEAWQDVSLFPSYIHGSEVCISPLKRNKHHDTTLANKLFQYMAGSRPLVVSDCPAQISIVEECACGLVHQADNPQDLAAQLLELYKNPTRARTLGANGREAVMSKYNWQKTAEPLLAYYANLSSD